MNLQKAYFEDKQMKQGEQCQQPKREKTNSNKNKSKQPPSNIAPPHNSLASKKNHPSKEPNIPFPQPHTKNRYDSLSQVNDME